MSRLGGFLSGSSRGTPGTGNPAPPTGFDPHNNTESPVKVNQDQPSLSSSQQEPVLQLRDHLVDLFEKSDRQTAWHPLFKNIAEAFNLAHGQLVNPSDLLKALPPMQEELRAVPLVHDEAKLATVRERFINMGGAVFHHLEEEHLPRWCPPRPYWNLPPAARRDPRQFWTKVWDSFDFSTPQFIDTTLSQIEQHADVVPYLYAIGSGAASVVKSIRYCFGDLERNWPYELGVDMLQGALKHGHGLKSRQQENELAIPFPWLDCRLSRFKSLGWSFDEEYDESHWRDRWIIDYHDLSLSDPLPPPIDEQNHFVPYLYKDVLLTNIRVPLPRPLLASGTHLLSALSALYTEVHPLQMLGEARTMAFELAGNPADDDDLRAGMLYVILSRLARRPPGFWDITTGEDHISDQAVESI